MRTRKEILESFYFLESNGSGGDTLSGTDNTARTGEEDEMFYSEGKLDTGVDDLDHKFMETHEDVTINDDDLE